MARRLLILFAALLGAGPAPALSAAPTDPASGAQNCARASFSAAPTHAPATRSESTCTRPGSVLGSARTALGCCVAAKGGAGALERLPEYAGGKTSGILDTGSGEIDLLSGTRVRPPNVAAERRG
jgi:hypothetical protein